MKLMKRQGLNCQVLHIIDNDGREIAITDKEWERLKRSATRFLKMPNTTSLILS